MRKKYYEIRELFLLLFLLYKEKMLTDRATYLKEKMDAKRPKSLALDISPGGFRVLYEYKMKEFWYNK